MKDFIEYSKRKGFGMTMFITKMKSPYGIVEFSSDAAINFKEKPESESTLRTSDKRGCEDKGKERA